MMALTVFLCSMGVAYGQKQDMVVKIIDRKNSQSHYTYSSLDARSQPHLRRTKSEYDNLFPVAYRRGKRILSDMDRDALLAAIGACRNACIRATTAAPIGEPIYVAAGNLQRAIDDLAEVLTGDFTHFHLKGGGPSTALKQP
jgi:hypothetical protein